jgi:CheY-like chemotaxis protein
LNKPVNDGPSPASAPKILVADDNVVVLKTISFALKSAGYHPLTAATASEAMTLARNENPDLILLDLNFPPDAGNVGGSLQDGLLILEWLHHMGEVKNTPVIMISVTEPEKYKDRAQAAGVVACLHKPIDNRQLLAAVESALRLHPTAADPDFEV